MPPEAPTAVPENLRDNVQRLKAAQLLANVTGMSFAQAGEALTAAGGFHELARLPDYALAALPHIGARRAQQIRAMTEWALLLGQVDFTEPVKIHSVRDVANLLLLEMSLLEYEELRVIGLNIKNEIRFMETIYKGSINSVVVKMAQILRQPILTQCASVILVHNHPSGDPTPSPEDVHMTEIVCESGSLLDIAVLDHVIIGRNRFVSLKERGLGFK